MPGKMVNVPFLPSPRNPPPPPLPRPQPSSQPPASSHPTPPSSSLTPVAFGSHDTSGFWLAFWTLYTFFSFSTPSHRRHFTESLVHLGGLLAAGASHLQHKRYGALSRPLRDTEPFLEKNASHLSQLDHDGVDPGIPCPSLLPRLSFPNPVRRALGASHLPRPAVP